MTRVANDAGRAGQGGDAFEARLFRTLLSAALADRTRTVPDRLGLPSGTIARLFATYFSDLAFVAQEPRMVSPAVEEDDLRQLLLDHRASGRIEEEWLAAIIARRAQDGNHLWEDLGLEGRDDLNRLMSRYFPALFARNTENMRWKKFFYRLMCEAEGLMLCKSPSCLACTDIEVCFEPGSRVLMQKAG